MENDQGKAYRLLRNFIHQTIKNKVSINFLGIANDENKSYNKNFA